MLFNLTFSSLFYLILNIRFNILVGCFIKRITMILTRQWSRVHFFSSHICYRPLTLWRGRVEGIYFLCHLILITICIRIILIILRLQLWWEKKLITCISLFLNIHFLKILLWIQHYSITVTSIRMIKKQRS